MDLGAMRSVARAAALVGASAVRSGVRPEVGAAKGLPGDWVTEVDLASERAIAGFLASETPSVPFVGEELGGDAASGLQWVVDPLDGTTNYVRGFWAVGVSVALVEDDRPVAGAVAAPFLDEVWHAAADGGCVWERPGAAAAPCRVSSRPPASAVVATGFPFRRKERLGPDLRALVAGAEPAVDVGCAESVRRPSPSGRGVVGSCVDRVWGVRRVLRARAGAVGRRRGRIARSGGGWRGDGLERWRRLARRRHPGRIACGAHRHAGGRRRGAARRVDPHIIGIGAGCSPGSNHVVKGASAAITSSTMPTAIEKGSPYRQTFSTKITPASTIIAGTFMAPTATNTIIKPQQHPTQNRP